MGLGASQNRVRDALPFTPQMDWNASGARRLEHLCKTNNADVFAQCAIESHSVVTIKYGAGDSEIPIGRGPQPGKESPELR